MSNTKLTPAFEYGYELGKLQLGVKRMFEQIAAGFQAALNPKAKLSADQLEAIAEMRAQASYQRRIDHERQVGLAFVRNEARRVRRELGLDPNDLA